MGRGEGNSIDRENDSVIEPYFDVSPEATTQEDLRISWKKRMYQETT